jgi:hypothetical protein
MKTEYAPDTANAWLEAARELAAANPIAAFVVAVVATAIFAKWAADTF